MSESQDAPQPAATNPSGILAVVDRAREEIAWVRSAYKFAVSVVATLIAVGLFFSYRSVQDLKADLREDGKHIQEQLGNEIALLGKTLQQELRSETDEVRSQVSARLDEEFRQENIVALIESKVQDRIDAEADKLIQDAVAARITPLRDELTAVIAESRKTLETQVHELSAKIKESQASEAKLQELVATARKTLAEVETQSQFVLTVIAAQNDDRDAFDRLATWSNDKGFPLRNEAQRAKFGVQIAHGGMFSRNKPYRVLEWKEHVRPERMSYQEVEQNWANLPPGLERAFVEFVWNHTNITQKQKYEFAAGVVTDSRGSLQAADEAARLLSERTKTKYNPPLDFGPLLEWWEKHSITNEVNEDATKKAIDGDEE